MFTTSQTIRACKLFVAHGMRHTGAHRSQQIALLRRRYRLRHTDPHIIALQAANCFGDYVGDIS